jgi:hypothetical protein
MADADSSPPAVSTNAQTPVKQIDTQVLNQLGNELKELFSQYSSDRRLTELKFMRNLRQYLGIYDPEVEKLLDPSRSRAYPRITRVKCISMLSRIMNLMYPGNERNWELNASPSPEMDPQDVAQAVDDLIKERANEGIQDGELTEDLIDWALQKMADKSAAALTKLIDDQLQEIGGDQTLDIIQLDRKVTQSGIMYGLGVLEGPYVRTVQKSGWAQVQPAAPTMPGMPPQPGGFKPVTHEIRKPQYDFLSVWDFYPDMSARKLPGEGYFVRKVMGKSQLRKLADREDFFTKEVKKIITNTPNGNYKPREFETELRVMGTKSDINDMKRDPQGKYEVIVWKGPVSGQKLRDLGADVKDDNLADDLEAEVWMIDGSVIKADINPWRKLGLEVKTVHCFVFDEDDTSPIGNGLPNVVRDSQMSIAAATRMTLDNASVTCGPQFEINTTLLRTDQDVTTIEAYKNWYRDDDGNNAQFPAVRRIEVDGHLNELQALITMFMQFADLETFIGPATGGDAQKMPSEPMRTAAGASMLRGDAALPFKDIVRNFDSYKQSVILSLVEFNKKFNPGLAPAGDYNVIARGATSLIAKEVRGMQLDTLAQTLQPEERDHIDDRKFVEQRLAVRDMQSMLVPEEEADRKRQAREQAQGQMSDSQMQLLAAQIRNELSQAFKNITQGQKNSAAADAQTSNAALDILEHALNGAEQDQGKTTTTRQ